MGPSVEILKDEDLIMNTIQSKNLGSIEVKYYIIQVMATVMFQRHQIFWNPCLDKIIRVCAKELKWKKVPLTLAV